MAKELSGKLPNVKLRVFSDRDLEPKRTQIEAALDTADVFFGSLLFDYDQVEWLKSRVDKIPVRLVFESALELMSSTQIGTFQVPLRFACPAHHAMSQSPVLAHMTPDKSPFRCCIAAAAAAAAAAEPLPFWLIFNMCLANC